MNRIRQLTALEANNYAVPLLNECIGCKICNYVSEYGCDQDDLVDLWGYFIKENLVGVIGLGSGLPGYNRRYLGYFAILESYRRKNIGSKLLAYLEDKINKMRIKEIIVETYDSDYFMPARKFYEKNGFVKVGYLNDFLGNGVGAVFYSKKYKRLGDEK